MTQSLKQGPNGPIIELDPKLAEELGLRVGSPVEVRCEGGRLIVEQADAEVTDEAERRRRFEEAKQWAFERYEKTFQKLAE